MRVTGQAVALPMENIDTDMIIPAEFLTSISREGYGQNLFRRLRDQNPNFPLNQARHAGARILIARKNFGCGSSREHAVWALLGAGIKAVIAPSFADIFSSNSGKNGLLLAPLESGLVEHLIQEANASTLELSLDLQTQILSGPGGWQATFPYDSFRKHCLLKGLDDMDYLLSHASAIARHRDARRENNFISPPIP